MSGKHERGKSPIIQTADMFLTWHPRNKLTHFEISHCITDSDGEFNY